MGRTASFIRRGEPEAAAEAIRRICRDVQLREHLYAEGQRTAETREWRQLRQQILETYRKLI